MTWAVNRPLYGAYCMPHILCGIWYATYHMSHMICDINDAIGVICENVNEWQRYKSWMWRLFGLEWPSNSQNCLTMTTKKFFYSASLLPHRLNYMVGLLSVYDFISNSPLELTSLKTNTLVGPRFVAHSLWMIVCPKFLR